MEYLTITSSQTMYLYISTEIQITYSQLSNYRFCKLFSFESTAPIKSRISMWYFISILLLVDRNAALLTSSINREEVEITTSQIGLYGSYCNKYFGNWSTRPTNQLGPACFIQTHSLLKALQRIIAGFAAALLKFDA